ncbi:MAG: hypothetical protein IJT43_11890 [Stomatobaculum sp.]|nr:hypothetical protein [Stomatobaculum sp.]
MIDRRAFSEDGYIADQDHTDGLRYGYWMSNYNGCGWIAVYNVLHYLGLSDDPERIFAEMLQILPYEGRRGTPFPTIARFFRERGIPARRRYGRAGLLKRADGAGCGIMRCVKEGAPHYVTFLRTEETDDQGRRIYRFLNVENGREDYRVSMEGFLSDYDCRGLILRLILPADRKDEK